MKQRKARFTAMAQKHLQLLEEWWRQNSARLEILQDDLAEAVQMLAVIQGIGSRYPDSPIARVRRLYLESPSRDQGG